jgi:hypothetical protein
VNLSRFAGALLATLGVLVCCGSGDDAPPPPSHEFGDGGKGDNPGGSGGICLLNNCTVDGDCADCDKGRQSCSQKNHRCIACGPDAGGKSCPDGQYCTQFGECVPNGVQCAIDGNGVPTITCSASNDCAACDPHHRICDSGSRKCVGCLPSDTTYCQSTEYCTPDMACAAKCPATCNKDSDCGKCGAPGHEAHACNKHVCAACSATKDCDGGLACDPAKGTCHTTCGQPGPTGPTDKCTADGNCSGCTAATKCDLPVNGGAGECSLPATGCSDVGKFAVLPAPFNTVTNLCSTDDDCRSVDVTYNAGKELRDLTGLTFIKDANIEYPMHACAAVRILGKSCGVCVPCKVDADCAPIDVLKFAGDAFGPLGAVATNVLLDKAFGPNDKKIHMQCDTIINGYGVCVPCGNFLNACGDGGDGPAATTCYHDECQPGGALAPTCTPCTTAVCAKDYTCCTLGWDDICKREVDDFCTTKTCLPDSCTARPPGWYCFEDATKGAYLCSDQHTVAAGLQCAAGQYCHKSGPGVKDPAVLCTKETDPGCGPGSLGKPECFATP